MRHSKISQSIDRTEEEHNVRRNQIILRKLRRGRPLTLRQRTSTGVLNDDAGNIDLLVKSAYGDESVSSIFICAAPHEIESLAAEYGLKKMHHVGVDVIGPIGAKLNNAGDDDFRRYMEFHFEVCEEPSYLGVSIHGLWIGNKQTGKR